MNENDILSAPAESNQDEEPRRRGRLKNFGRLALTFLVFCLAASNVGLSLVANFSRRPHFDEGKDILYLQSVGATVRFANGRMNLHQNAFVRFLLDPGVKIQDFEATVKLSRNSDVLLAYGLQGDNYFAVRLRSSLEYPSEILEFAGGNQQKSWPLAAPLLRPNRENIFRADERPDGVEFFLNGQSLGMHAQSRLDGGSLAFSSGTNPVKIENLLVRGVREDGSPWSYKETFSGWPVKKRWFPIAFGVVLGLGVVYMIILMLIHLWGSSLPMGRILSDVGDRLFPLLLFMVPAALPVMPLYPSLVLFLSAVVLFHWQMFGYFLKENRVFRLEAAADRLEKKYAGKTKARAAAPAVSALVVAALFVLACLAREKYMSQMLEPDSIDDSDAVTTYSEEGEIKFDSSHPILITDSDLFFEVEKRENPGIPDDPERTVAMVIRALSEQENKESYYIDPEFLKRLAPRGSLKRANLFISFEFFPEKDDMLTVDFFKGLEPRKRKEAIHSSMGGDHEYYSFFLSADPEARSLLTRVSGTRVVRSLNSTYNRENYPKPIPEQWNSVRIEAAHGMIKAKLNGELVDYVEDNSSFERSNTINIMPLSKWAKLRNLEVRTAGDKQDERVRGRARFHIAEAARIYMALALILMATAAWLAIVTGYPAGPVFSVFFKTIFFQFGLFLMPCIFLARTGFTVSILNVFYGISILFAMFFYLCIYHTNKMSFRRRPLATVGFLALFVALIELGSWVFSPLTPMYKFKWHEGLTSPKTYWFFDPMVRHHNYYFNFHALRLRRPNVDKKGDKRFILLGGSQSWGEGTPFADPNIFVFLLENKLSRFDTGSVWEGVNGANGSSASFTELQFLKGALLNYEPDYVLMNFAHNDLKLERGNQDDYKAYEVANAQPMGLLDRRRVRPITPVLLQKFNVKSGDKIFYQALMSTADRLTRIPGLSLLRAAYQKEQSSTADKFYYFEKNLESFYELSRQYHFQMVLIKEPYYTQELDLTSSDIDRIYGIMDKFAQKHDCLIIDAHRMMFEYRNENLFLDPLHMTPHGHQRMAEVLFNGLRNGGIFEGELHWQGKSQPPSKTPPGQ